MSTAFGRGMAPEESIYNLIPTPQFHPERPPLYRSQNVGKVEPGQFEMGVKVKKGHATFGKPNGASANRTDTFVRAHGKEPVLPEPTKPSTTKLKTKPPVPLATEKPVMGLCSDKNFVTANAVEAILAKPQKVPTTYPHRPFSCWSLVVSVLCHISPFLPDLREGCCICHRFCISTSCVGYLYLYRLPQVSWWRVVAIFPVSTGPAPPPPQ